MGLETIVAIATIAAAGATVGSTIAASGRPDLPTPPPVPEPGADPREGAAASAQAQRLRRRRGRASTILTGPAAFGAATATQGTKQLLGQ
ncbi:hypothetical protein LCGC14_1311680 [marine sediment metagenome]|uniref:Uncharacterized protein n=1 Tax=marine sediment metagenome TaxID=412755 RepID=A0A0F9KM46_9ZZZZ